MYLCEGLVLKSHDQGWMCGWARPPPILSWNSVSYWYHRWHLMNSHRNVEKPSSIFKTIFWSLKIYPRHSELSFEFSGHFTNASWWKHPTWANSVLLQVLADAMEEGRKLLMRSLETSLASGWRYVVVVETHMSTKTCNSNKKQAADCIFQTLSIIEPLPSSKHCRLCLVQHFVALPRVMA